MGLLRDLFARKDNGDFWGEYKLTHPNEARIIEQMTGENFSLLSNKDVKEKFASLERLASNSGCSIINVKDVVLDSFKTEVGDTDDILRQAIQRFAESMTEESIRYNIQKTNTASFYIRKWLLEIVGKPFEYSDHV